MVFMGVFLFQLVIVQGLSSSYMRRLMKEKIEESYQNSLRQTTLNLDTSLKGYKKAIDELFRDTDFIMAVNELNSMNDENETVTWKLEVDRGVVVTDERWVYSESTEEYQLLSEDSDNHAYVLGEEQTKLPVWKNLLVWEE